MADAHSTTPSNPQNIRQGSVCGSVPASQQDRPYAPSPHSNDQYEPLPPGCWTLNFHGNCPKCHHHNKALQVQVKVTPDACHVNYVHCERCQDRWAAIGGRNITRTSLLSTATTEPDLAARGVRYSLFEIVKLAQERQALSTLLESPTAAPSHAESTVPNTRTISRTSSPSPDTSISISTSDILHGTPVQADHPHSGTDPTQDETVDFPEAKISRSCRALRLFVRVKTRLTTSFSMLRRTTFRQWIKSSGKPKMSPIYFEDVPAQTPPATGGSTILVDQMHLTAPSTQNSTEQLPIAPDAFQAKVVEPSKRVAEVVAFLARLDKSVLESKSEAERIEWMRKEYTTFKASRERRMLPLSMSAIVHTSVAPESAHSVAGPRSRVSIEVLGIGAQMEDLQMMESLEAALNAGSITISETTSENVSMPDENQLLQGSHLRSGRPQSLPVTFHPPLRLQHLARNSYDARLSTDRQATSSMSGQAPSRLSQGSTFWTSPRSDDRSMSQETLQPATQEYVSTHEDTGESIAFQLTSQDRSTLGRDLEETQSLPRSG